jgi:hypothetical protein
MGRRKRRRRKASELETIARTRRCCATMTTRAKPKVKESQPAPQEPRLAFRSFHHHPPSWMFSSIHYCPTCYHPSSIHPSIKMVPLVCHPSLSADPGEMDRQNKVFFFFFFFFQKFNKIHRYLLYIF